MVEAIAGRDARGQNETSGLDWRIALPIIGHACLWIAIPATYLGNLHTDTVEATSWATHWAWGYQKHPPLVTWLFRVLQFLPGPRLVQDLILAQASVVVSAILIWRALRALAPAAVAAVGVFIYLASPPATYFAVQVNHNSLSIPFEAGVLAFGLAYFERGAWVDVIALGVVAGLALLTKYETAFFLFVLVGLAALRQYRWVWRDPRSYLCVLIALSIFAPHLWWDAHHGWRTLLYASSDRPLRTMGDVGASLNELLDGLLMCVVGPTLLWAISGFPRLRIADGRSVQSALVIGLVPIAAMIVLGFASGQVLRQGWLIPLMPAVAVAVALAVRPASAPVWRALEWRSFLLSLLQALAFGAFLLTRSALGHPVAAYSLNGAEFSEALSGVWSQRFSGDLSCVLTPNRSFALSLILHLHPMPAVFDLDLSDREGSDPVAPCRATGGVAIVPDGPLFTPALRSLGLAEDRIAVGPWPALGSYRWIFQVYFIPAER